MNAKKLLEAALALTPEERALLAHDLIYSLDGHSDADAEAAWIDEIERRARELADGTVAPVDWNDVRERIRQRLQTHHE